MTESEVKQLSRESCQNPKKYCCKITVTTTTGAKDILKFGCIEENTEVEHCDQCSNEQATIMNFQTKYPNITITKENITVADDNATNHTFCAYVIT